VLCSFPTCPHEKRRLWPRGRHTFTSKGEPRSPTSSATQLLLSHLFPFLLSIRMNFSQEHWNCNHGTLCTVALHPSISSIDSYMQSPPSKPFRSRSPPPHPRAGAQPPRPSTPQPYVFSDDADVGQDIAHIIHTHSSVSSSQSLPRTSSHSSSSRKQQATQRPIRQNSSWHTFHSCSACLAL
jgi:hypothetical protein